MSKPPERVQPVSKQKTEYKSHLEFGSEEFLERACVYPNPVERRALVDSLDFSKEEDALIWCSCLSRHGAPVVLDKLFNGYWLVKRSRT